MDKHEALEKLRGHSKNLSAVSYEDIVNLMKNGIKQIPIPTAKVKKKAHIDRARPNKGRDLYEHVDRLGYIKDQETIDNKLVEFGRANCPHQVMFYGAVETSVIDKQRLTAIAETSDLFRENKNCPEGKYYTVSRWETLDEFLVVEVVFSEYALKYNPDIQKSYEKQKQFLQSLGLDQKDIDFHLDFLKFISEEFSKKVANPNDYKITAAYTNIALQHLDVIGIAYPSVQTEYFGVNVVLTPEGVKKYLKPILCSTQIVYRSAGNTIIANGEHYCDTIDESKNLEWKDSDKSILTDYKEVKTQLKIT